MIWGQALSLYQPVRGDLGVSSRRSSLQFIIRPRRSLAGQSVATAEASSSNRQSVDACGALGARKKGPEVRLNGFGSNRFRGEWLIRGGPAPYASSAMRPTAHTQQASSRAVATFALLPWTPRASSASRLSTSLRTPLAACLRAAGSGAWPLARSFGRPEHVR